MVQIDCLVMLASPNRLVQIDKVVFFMLVIMSILKLKNLNKKAMNCSNYVACIRTWTFDLHDKKLSF
jgi:hypothetical protein